MKRATYNVLFLVRKTKKRKNGLYPIHCRLTVNGKRAEFVIQQEVPYDEWDNLRECVKGNTKKAREINNYLDLVKSKLIEQKVIMQEKNEAVTAVKLKDSYLGVNSNQTSLLELYDDHNTKCMGLINKDFAPATIQKHITTRKHLSEFMQLKYKKKDLELNVITPSFVEDFEYYMKVERNCGNNTTVKHMKNLKKIFRIATENNYTKNNPFVNKKYRWDNTDLAYLTEEELNEIMNRSFSIERLEQVKDVYLFCCFTGLAFIDVKNLTGDDVVEQNNKLWIKKKRQKTKNLCVLPLLEPAFEILKKYEPMAKAKTGNNLLPVPSNQKMNAYLKEIADLCGIKKNLSTHTARHTFATTVTLLNQVSIEVVSKMLGHSSTNMTKRYARVVDALINKDMEKLYGKYSIAQ